METENDSRPQNNDWKEREVGALWKKSGKSQNYFSGRVSLENYKDEKFVNIVGFANKGKRENPNAPDVILYYSAPTSTLDLESSNSTSKIQAKEESSSAQVEKETEQGAEEEVPF